MSNSRGKYQRRGNASFQKWLIRIVQKKKRIRKRSEGCIRDGCSLCGGASHNHMFKELLQLLTQKHAPGPRSSGELWRTEGGFLRAHVSELVGMHKMQRTSPEAWTHAETRARASTQTHTHTHTVYIQYVWNSPCGTVHVLFAGHVIQIVYMFISRITIHDPHMSNRI